MRSKETVLRLRPLPGDPAVCQDSSLAATLQHTLPRKVRTALLITSVRLNDSGQWRAGHTCHAMIYHRQSPMYHRRSTHVNCRLWLRQVGDTARGSSSP
ncbi:hypothetical protein E2C01_101589 [Portunus trituberculatus]|uniref:Uncharacterized protein n=1 Tax=Portunus trituberculatus TaxID=210409 RepID=A0A5B7K9Z9_PORTR|nr:hypothetical protein [Portunus trituberculatus]